MNKYIEKDFKNKKYGRLTILNFVGMDKHSHRKIFCKCECGRFVTVRLDSLTNGNVKSCGCFRREKYRIHKQSIWEGIDKNNKLI